MKPKRWMVLPGLVLAVALVVKGIERYQGFSIGNVVLVGAKRLDPAKMFREISSLASNDFDVHLPSEGRVIRAGTRDGYEYWIEMDFPPGATKVFANKLAASVIDRPSSWLMKAHGPGAVGQLNGPPLWWPRQPWRLPERMVLDRRAQNGGVKPPYTYHWGFDHNADKVYVWMQCDF